MKKAQWLYGTAIGVLVIGIILVIIFRFILPPKNPNAVNIKEFEKVSVIDLNGEQVRLADLAKKDQITYCMIFELTNCFSCIQKGIDDLKTLKKEGKSCIALAVHELIDEVNGFSATVEFAPFFMLKKKDFYEYVTTAHLPVMIKLKNGEVESFRYITP
ncbi:MAG: hypothetical protein ACM3SY_21825 [Candidatus Omnitrophota bacterium]